MKKVLLLVVLSLMAGCTKKYNLQGCVEEVERRLKVSEANLTHDERVQVDMGVTMICDMAKNDPDDAMEMIKEIQESH